MSARRNKSLIYVWRLVGTYFILLDVQQRHHRCSRVIRLLCIHTTILIYVVYYYFFFHSVKREQVRGQSVVPLFSSLKCSLAYSIQRDARKRKKGINSWVSRQSNFVLYKAKGEKCDTGGCVGHYLVHKLSFSK